MQRHLGNVPRTFIAFCLFTGYIRESHFLPSSAANLCALRFHFRFFVQLVLFPRSYRSYSSVFSPLSFPGGRKPHNASQTRTGKNEKVSSFSFSTSGRAAGRIYARTERKMTPCPRTTSWPEEEHLIFSFAVVSFLSVTRGNAILKS